MLPDAVRKPSEQLLQNSGLSKRALNALMRGGIQTLEAAAEWSDKALLSLPHFGPTSVAALRRLQQNSQQVTVLQASALSPQGRDLGSSALATKSITARTPGSMPRRDV